ncbi:MAG: DUF454 domain-containing protein [Gammaproteobacteria bacterium]|nr:DUF454 domain-containing protein [Gammaproteobacteria bacterium]MCP4979116.1 DUF454 domain-containing protein [Gammaproteobacteria bacterium]
MSENKNQINQADRVPGRHSRFAYLVLAYVAVAIGIAGVFLPLLPATPFLLIAVWAGSRGSQRVHDWIFEQPQFARLINDWREQGAVPLSAKWAATVMMIASYSTLIWSQAYWLLLLGMGIFFIGIGSFLWTRPNPSRRL